MAVDGYEVRLRVRNGARDAGARALLDAAAARDDLAAALGDLPLRMVWRIVDVVADAAYESACGPLVQIGDI